MDVSCINIKSYTPLKKDIDRAENLSWCRGSYYGSGAPFHSEASKMAKLIKDPDKLIRRAIAVVMRWGTNDYIGYDASQIIKIMKYLLFLCQMIKIKLIMQ